MRTFSWLCSTLLFLSLMSCGDNTRKQHQEETPEAFEEPTEVPPIEESEGSYGSEHIDWAKNAVIYEVNVRQYSEKGDFAGFEAHLPRLKELGVDVLWFMPIHPIGVKNRKETEASMGSYYAVKDYKAVNPDFGTLEDFKALVQKCHEMGFKVVLDWVANHSAPDNAWVEEHPEFYTKDEEGNYPIPPVGTDWWDVADLNYDEPGLRAAMIDAMKFWVDECDIDGYRCDVAGEVPLEFWEEARPQLEEKKKLFMLAEWEDENFYKAFDFTYAWHLNHLMTEISAGKQTVEDLVKMSCKEVSNWVSDSLSVTPWGPYSCQMNFTTNHDENSWKNSVFERLGPAHRMWAALSFTAPGLPLIYSGQEVGNGKVLKFFDKDEIDWTQDSLSNFYAELVKMKHENTALWIGENGGSFESFKVENENIYGFYREGSEDMILAFFNMSDKKQVFAYPSANFINQFETGSNGLTLKPWEYKIFTAKTNQI